MRHLLKEPLLAFFLIGGGLFVLFQQVATEPAGDQVIEVDQGRIDALTQHFEKIWHRPPSAKETDGLIRAYVQDEIWYREARKLGLDKDDRVIKRRLRQKMSIISENVANVEEPDDDKLQSYLDVHKARYQLPAHYTFRQIYIDIHHRGVADAKKLAGELLHQLQHDQAIDFQQLGDPIMLAHQFSQVSSQEVQRTFGKSFAMALDALPTGQWLGPVKSGYGLHLVKVDVRKPGAVPSLDRVRKQVKRDYMSETQRQANAELYESMRKQYTVRIEGKPEPAGSQGKG